LIGTSPAMRELFQVLEVVAATPSTILITGETGTGKELVARAIHHAGTRRDQRFVAINCGALPESLLEAELLATCAARSRRHRQPPGTARTGAQGHAVPR